VEAALLAWFDEHARDLPWRKTRDPYAILVSEVMLQQSRARFVVSRSLNPVNDRSGSAVALDGGDSAKSARLADEDLAPPHEVAPPSSSASGPVERLRATVLT
jgi:hypothetical protein